MWDHYTPNRKVKIFLKISKIPNAEKLGPAFMAGRNIKWYHHSKKLLVSNFLPTKHMIIIQLSHYPLWLLPKKNKNLCLYKSLYLCFLLNNKKGKNNWYMSQVDGLQGNDVEWKAHLKRLHPVKFNLYNILKMTKLQKWNRSVVLRG